MNRPRPDQPHPKKPVVLRFEAEEGGEPSGGEPRGPLPGAAPAASGTPDRRPQPAGSARPGNAGSQANWASSPPRRPQPPAGSPPTAGAPSGALQGPDLRLQRGGGTPWATGGVQPQNAAATPEPGRPAPPAAETQLGEIHADHGRDAEAQFLAKRTVNDLAALQDGVQRKNGDAAIPAQFKDVLHSTSISPRQKLEAWLAVMAHTRASDLILRAGGRPSLRVNGRIQFLPGRVPGPGPLLEVLEGVMGERRMNTWRETGSADAGLQLDGLGRFRLNAYRQLGEPAVVLRRINQEAPVLETLDLPAEELKKLSLKKRGIVLVTGIAGSGKSTTLAAMIEHMNQTVERHIVTLEDPVELLFTESRCVISQREVGTDCTDFQDGLRHALRQSPDVILIGEMRDAETVSAALDATETGHLVLSTLHTVNAAQTMERILSFFSAQQHDQVRQRLADNIAGILSQRLVPKVEGDGLLPAYELMVSTPHVRELIADGKTSELGRVIDAGGEGGLISFNQVLKRLVSTQRVDLNDALAASDRPEELVLALRGITGSSQKVDVHKARELRSQGGGEGLRLA